MATAETITSNGHTWPHERPEAPMQAQQQSTAHIAELAGLILRSRQHLIETEKETAWRGRHLDEAEQQIHEWANSFRSADGGEPPTTRQVSARWGWWRRVWREYRWFSTSRTLLQEAMPWLAAYRDHLTAQAEPDPQPTPTDR